MGGIAHGTFSVFVLRPLGGPGLPYFQSSYPCLICWSSLMIHPLILPSCLESHSLSPSCAQASRPSYQCSRHCCAPLTDNVKPIDSGPHFSFPQHLHHVLLDVLPSPLSSCLQKQEIIQNDPANCSSSCCQRWRCCHPKARSVCQPDGSLISHGLLPMQSFSTEKPDIECRWQRWPTRSLSGVSQRRRVWILAYCQTIPPPPPKGECLQCTRVILLRPG